MPPLFLSLDARQRDSWREAFPDLVTGRLDAIPSGCDFVWALQPIGEECGVLAKRLRARLGHGRFVILSDTPTEGEALAALAEGASGFCNGHAAPEVLQQVSRVVENGGVWVGQGLMQRLLAATSRLLPEVKSESWRAALTAREQETALLIAKGASNKEIARQLDITERTDKAHVSAMLEKLGARDRLQLSLIVNGVEKSR